MGLALEPLASFFPWEDRLLTAPPRGRWDLFPSGPGGSHLGSFFPNRSVGIGFVFA